MTRHGLSLVHAGCLAVLLLAGCGGKPEAVGLVSGTVTLDGKPVANIGIAFIPAVTGPEAGPVATAETDATGRYEVSYIERSNALSAPPVRKPGAALGLNRIVLEDAKQKAEHLPQSRVLPRYIQPETSGFELDVQPGSQTFDIDLRSR